MFRLQKNTHFWLMLILLAILIVAILAHMEEGGSFIVNRLQGRVLVPENKLEVPWRTYDPQEVWSGATIPPDTNVIIHIPLEVKRITRKVLFGRDGNRIRYWGYCFPADYDAKKPVQTAGFPGTMFLSEAERATRDQVRNQYFPDFNIFQPPTSAQLERMKARPIGRIRHQQEIFYGGTTCFIMAAEPLPLGADHDGDQLNSKLEAEAETDPDNPDTDGDGMQDGMEFFSHRTDPLRRDTDTDGIIDGIEDKNRNGRIDSGETDPKKKDSDNDGLCDGYCRVLTGGRICSEFKTTKSCIPAVGVKWKGEDKNLNGIVDEGEFSPLKIDTDNDGILDEQEHYNCLLEKKADC